MADFSPTKIVMTRTPHLCWICQRIIPKGSKCESAAMFDEGTAQTFYSKPECRQALMNKENLKAHFEDCWHDESWQYLKDCALNIDPQDENLT